jgi:Spy/CpxP family protein refolding chaperone
MILFFVQENCFRVFAIPSRRGNVSRSGRNKHRRPAFMQQITLLPRSIPMRRFPAFVAIFGILAIAAFAVQAGAQEGPPGGPDGGGQGRPQRRGGPGGGFHLIPPFAAEKLNLTADQKKQIEQLEKETKAKLSKILTPEQQKLLETARPPRPGKGGRRGPGGGPDNDQGGGFGGPGGPNRNGPGGQQPPQP